MKVILLGGYGTFGSRLAERLDHHKGLDLVIAGRSASKAADLCDRLTGPANTSPLTITRAQLSDQLAQLNADLVIDATGPFQDYGDSGYDLVKSCLISKTNYVDFADSADFVSGIAQFNEDAKNSDIFALSGASSFPTLTAAVVQDCAKNMEILEITGGAAPSPHATVGLNVIRAVISYAGQPVALTRNGQVSSGTGLLETKTHTIATPGQKPLKPRRFALVDVPDLQVLPKVYPSLETIWMGASIYPKVVSYAITGLAWFRKKRLLPDVSKLSPAFFWISNKLRYGENRGGMFIEIRGRKDGAEKSVSWHLTAPDDSGPYIPTMASEIIVQRMLDGKNIQTGARAATDGITLADFDPIFAERNITHGFRNGHYDPGEVFQTNLSYEFKLLPDKVQKLHTVTDTHEWVGKATVQRGKNPIGNLVARMFGFPNEGSNQTARVTIEKTSHGETWNRYIGNGHFRSHLSTGKGKSLHHINERFGLFTVQLAMVVRDKKLFFVPVSWRIGPFRLPRAILPQGQSYEHESDDKFHFDVTIKAPFIGLIAAYKGWLEPA